MKEFEAKIDIAYAKSIMAELSGFVDNPLVGNRSSASDAEHAAADYLIERMEKAGLQNVTKDACQVDQWKFERGTISFEDSKGNQCMSALGGYATRADFQKESFKLIYAGRGTEQDLAGLDVAGKIVLIDIDQMNDWWINFPAYEVSLNHAAALICCNNEGFGQIGEDTLVSEDICGPCEFPVFSVCKKTAGELQKLWERCPEGVEVCIDAKSTIETDKVSYNVWGEIPGETEEAIIVINHYDAYYRTVFDDVQGIGWALGIAKALIDSNYQPYRTIRFVAHASEEWGLINNKYDWAIGAFKQIHHIRPKWQSKGFTVVNLDGFYACAGETRFCIPCCKELYGFVSECIKPYTDNEKYTFEANLELTSSTEDFSYELAGIPSFVAGAYDGCQADRTVLHSSYSEFDAGFDDELFWTIHSMFGKIILDLDQLAVRPVDFTLRTREIVETLPDTAMGEKAEFARIVSMAEQLKADVGKINRSITLKDCSKEMKHVSEEVNLELHEVFKYLIQHYLRFDWNDKMLVPHQRYISNITALQNAKELLEKEEIEKAAEALGEVDYNYYAFHFSRKTFDYFVRQVTENTADTWGTGLVENGNQDLYDVIRLLMTSDAISQETMADIGKAIADAIECQTDFLRKTIQDERNNLLGAAEHMQKAKQKLSVLLGLLK